jgi:hypothetical protein
MASKGYKEYEVTIEGTVPIVMHNGQTADPLNPYSKAIKQVSSKRKKVDDDYEKMAALEWEAALYLDKQKRVILNDYVVESCIVGGAKKSKSGQQAKTALFVSGDAEFLVDGRPVTLDEIKGKPEYRLAVPVKVGMARVVRTRPKFDKWSSKFTLQVMDNVANESEVKDWLRDAGMLVGLCDWRPKFGRFKVVAFSEKA